MIGKDRGILIVASHATGRMQTLANFNDITIINVGLVKEAKKNTLDQELTKPIIIHAMPHNYYDLPYVDINHPKNNQPFYVDIMKRGSKKRKGYRK